MEQNDLPIEVVLRKIGECPVCHKGQMTQGTAGWTCDYFQSLQDKCTFTIFLSYDGYVLHEEDAVQLITVGETDYKPFVTLSGKEFTARLKRVGDKIKVVGDNAVLGLPCPVCGRKVKELQNGYACEGFFKEDVEHCNLYIPKTICERSITKDEAEDLLENISTEVLDGFIANGKQFSSCLKIGPDGTVTLDGEICRCPKCGGKVFAGIKAFNCSNYRNPAVRCDFVVWRVMSGHRMTVDEIRTLCTQGATPVLEFRTREGVSYARRLAIDDKGNVKMV